MHVGGSGFEREDDSVAILDFCPENDVHEISMRSIRIARICEYGGSRVTALQQQLLGYRTLQERQQVKVQVLEERIRTAAILGTRKSNS